MALVVVVSSAASAANGMTPVRTVCKYFTLSDAKQVFGSTVSRVPRTAPGSCLYSTTAATLNTGEVSNPSPGVLVQMSRGPKPQALSGKPTPGAQRVRVGSAWGWYTGPTTSSTNAGASIWTLCSTPMAVSSRLPLRGQWTIAPRLRTSDRSFCSTSDGHLFGNGSVLSPPAIAKSYEDAVSVLLSQMHPASMRIDGSGGDGGRDVPNAQRPTALRRSS